jgi:hypothetical protein
MATGLDARELAWFHRPMRAPITLAFLFASVPPASCGDDGGHGGPDAGPGPDAAPRPDAAHWPDAGPPPDGAPFPPSPERFRYGANLGHPNAAWGDDVHAGLAAASGVRSLRVKLPAAHLERWGDAIEVADLEAYAALGLHSHVGYLTGAATAEQSLKPSGEPDWKLEWYPPRNLHEPIFLPGGEVNPDNHWADYVRRVVSTYSPWIRVWHVWNEPDWVADWQVTLTWDTEPPAAEDLPRWNGSIFDYIRMLRITHEVARQVDPWALVATGGLGYASFLDAILRYTDDPVDGSVNADHPLTGGAYVDVLDLHYYPVFGVFR